MSRYEIHEVPASESAISYGAPPVYYVVWDTETKRRIPFGKYRTRENAQYRIARLEAQ